MTRQRLLFANLDAEADLDALCRPQAPRWALPRRALATIAGYSTLLRAFAEEGDELRTLVPVAPERLGEVPGLPRPRLAAGALRAHEEAAALLAWAETPATAAWRGRHPSVAGPLSALPLHEAVWGLPAVAPEVVAAVHHRGFCLRLAQTLDLALPRARLLSSLAELEAHLGSDPDPGGWVVKAPLAAAGRSRYVHRGGPLATAAVRRLFARHGELLFEPWMERVGDFGCAALTTAEATRLVSFHRLLVDRDGRFTGLELDVEPRGFPGLAPAEGARMAATVQRVGEALRGAGYLGAFGIDAWRYRRRDGAVAFQPLGEINARMTFGWVARALVDRVREPLGLAPHQRVRLVFGGRQVDSEDRASWAILTPDAAAGGVFLDVLQPSPR